jgi:integrase
VARMPEPWFRASRGAWFATVDGKQVRLDAADIESARNALASILARLDRSHVKSIHPTVRNVTSGFMGAFNDAPANSIKCYRTRLKRLGPLGELPVDVATPRDGLAWLGLFDESPVSRGQRAATLKRALRWGVSVGMVPDDAPLLEWRVPMPRSPRRIIPTVEQVPAWLAVMNPALRGVAEFLANTGARQDEARRIEAKHVDLSAHCVVMAEHKTASRTGSVRIIPVPGDDVWARLVELCDLHPSGPVFRNNAGRAWNPDVLYGALRRAARRAGLVKITGHSLRHRCATDLNAAGVPAVHGAGILGHTVETYIKTYCHSTTDPRVLVEQARRRGA